jgi:hypothetical protein
MDLLQKFQVLQLLSRSSAQHNSARRSNCLKFILDQKKKNVQYSSRMGKRTKLKEPGRKAYKMSRGKKFS